jgi:hypothetical protein
MSGRSTRSFTGRILIGVATFISCLSVLASCANSLGVSGRYEAVGKGGLIFVMDISADTVRLSAQPSNGRAVYMGTWRVKREGEELIQVETVSEGPGADLPGPSHGSSGSMQIEDGGRTIRTTIESHDRILGRQNMTLVFRKI